MKAASNKRPTGVKAPALILLLLLVLAVLFLALRPEASGSPQERTFDLAIQDGTASPAEISVGEGDRVRLRISSDRPVEIHVHGYDLEGEVEPGETTELSFDATTTGRFSLEDHHSEAVLGELIVRPR